MLYCYLCNCYLCNMVFCKFYKLYPVLVSMLCGSVRTKGIQVPSTYVRICTALLCLVYYL